ncbi:MAG: hypothetical protein KDA52_00680 [Planctomycetaceae bacterium]|nr:hypothetical protein [Planctomycetaceae bacterium]
MNCQLRSLAREQATSEHEELGPLAAHLQEDLQPLLVVATFHVGFIEEKYQAPKDETYGDWKTFSAMRSVPVVICPISFGPRF